ncbi:glycoside hydrolase [Paenibacillus sp. PK3_47]|uniref:glycoside hydrolase family 5 protein n=1 Tax=Paenibacillus sp. PK3_47 TaxID=2072642 RepID=UPI00201DF045|nr:cellulase family glycosylhydrolase [Paenibacillus sp. PK3_47]UQZ36783.1 glycoside hydrolase [Paenibacillus sp. PK3_47]
MNGKLSSSRVQGFLRAEGRSVVNEAGEEIVLTGWGLGNWLLQEGYMWTTDGNSRFDRPRRIEAVVRELTGSKYSERFWTAFRENYITREDIRMMAQQGYNSVRIPFNWRILMEDEPGIIWKEEGFRLIDRCLDWCEEFKLYAFLDLHGAPGGQTGQNIDDSIDDVPRLFTDQDSWDKGIALWRTLADRYKDRWIVGGYDLLNEPIRTPSADSDFGYLVPRLVAFYEEAIAAIRAVDSKHMLSVEGHHWATNPSIFYKKYDDNMVVHFHRYACYPELSSFREFIEVSERLNVPLWMGETGENLNEWYTALYPLSAELNIGYNVWPWKKMDNTNSPYSVNLPEGWNQIMDYTRGGVRPGYEQAWAIFDRYLENIKIENCRYNAEVTQAVLRLPGCTVRATDFDELPGKGIAYSGLRTEGNLYNYRSNTGMHIVEDIKLGELRKRFFFDILWDRFLLEMTDGEFAGYSINDTTEESSVAFVYSCNQPVSVTVRQDEKDLVTLTLQSDGKKQAIAPVPLFPAGSSRIKIVVNAGTLRLEKLMFR